MKIVLIGAGNVGWHLGCRLKVCGENIVQVFSRNLLKAKLLGENIDTLFTNALDEIDANADLYILAVNDDAIREVGSTLASRGGLKEKLFVHTSGATPSSIFAETFERYGVFYPLQTFSKAREPDFSQIPICIDASNDEDLKLLTSLAKNISRSVYRISDDQRAILHVAAVFVNNFTNHLFEIGYDILKNENLPFGLLMPLIRETVEKLQDGTPHEMQTGPAIRSDSATIHRHLLFLEKYPAYLEIYRQLTQSIQLTPIS